MKIETKDYKEPSLEWTDTKPNHWYLSDGGTLMFCLSNRNLVVFSESGNYSLTISEPEFLKGSRFTEFRGEIKINTF